MQIQEERAGGVLAVREIVDDNTPPDMTMTAVKEGMEKTKEQVRGRYVSGRRE